MPRRQRQQYRLFDTTQTTVNQTTELELRIIVATLHIHLERSARFRRLFRHLLQELAPAIVDLLRRDPEE